MGFLRGPRSTFFLEVALEKPPHKCQLFPIIFELLFLSMFLRWWFAFSKPIPSRVQPYFPFDLIHINFQFPLPFRASRVFDETLVLGRIDGFWELVVLTLLCGLSNKVVAQPLTFYER